MINSGRGQAADDLARASVMAAAAACKITIWQQGTAPPVPLAGRAAPWEKVYNCENNFALPAVNAAAF